MRPLFVGNFNYVTLQSELERLFSKYGKVDRVDLKAGYAFVYFEDERDAKHAIKNLNDTPFGDDKRRLSVQWAKGAPPHGKEASLKPTKTLFVINFDPYRTKALDIKKHFDPYGKILDVRIRSNFAFVQFETQEDATKAFQALHKSKILDRVISVEYSLKEYNERDDRDADSPRGAISNGRSANPSPPINRRRPSPDYGRHPCPECGKLKRPTAHYRRRIPAYDRRTRSPRAGYDRCRSQSTVRRGRTDQTRI